MKTKKKEFNPMASTIYKRVFEKADFLLKIAAIKVGSRSARISPSSRSSSVTKHAEPDTVYYMGTSSGVSDFHVKARRKP